MRPEKPTIQDHPGDPKARHIREFSDLASVDAEGFVAELKENSFMIARGLLDADTILNGAQELRNKFDINQDNPSQGIRPEQILHNFQKWSIGVTSPRHYLPRLYRIFYNPFWAEDIYRLHSQFEILSEFRNILCGMPVGYGKKVEPDGLYSGVRIQQYPRGGGFIGVHTDDASADNVIDSDNRQFIQALIPMTIKGKDYHTGGGYIQKGNVLHFVDDLCEIGDIVVYDSSTLHGCLDIDPEASFQPNDINGRLVGFVTLYRQWQ